MSTRLTRSWGHTGTALWAEEVDKRVVEREERKGNGKEEGGRGQVGVGYRVKAQWAQWAWAEHR